MLMEGLACSVVFCPFCSLVQLMSGGGMPAAAQLKMAASNWFTMMTEPSGGKVISGTAGKEEEESYAPRDLVYPGLTLDCKSCHNNLHVNIISGIADIHASHQWLGIVNGQGAHHLAIPWSIHRLHCEPSSWQFLRTTITEEEPRDSWSGETFSRTCEGGTVCGNHHLDSGECSDCGTNWKMEMDRLSQHC